MYLLKRVGIRLEVSVRFKIRKRVGNERDDRTNAGRRCIVRIQIPRDEGMIGESCKGERPIWLWIQQK